MSDYGSLKPDSDLADVFRHTVKDVAEEEHGAVKSGVNTALLVALHLLEAEDPDAVEYNLDRAGYEDLADLQRCVENRQSVPFVLDLEPVSQPDPSGSGEAIETDFSFRLSDAEDGEDNGA